MVCRHINYLAANRMPPHFSHKDRRKLAKKKIHYSWIDNNLFYTGPDQIMRRCVREDEIYEILHAFMMNHVEAIL